MEVPRPAPVMPMPTSHTARRLLPLAAIAVIALLLAAAFAWTAGWIGPRTTARHFIDRIESSAGKHPGFRRAHSKGVCVSGWFQGTAQGAALSSARVFSQPQVPVLGRLSIGGADPQGDEAMARVRSMALQLHSDDGQQWRMAMNSFPFFAAPSAEVFLEQTQAQMPEPATGKPDPARLAALAERYPSIAAFQQWAKQAPWSDSWANTAYNGIHTFRFVNAAGQQQSLRWSMQPLLPFAELPAVQRQQAAADYLEREFAQRLARGPVQWTLQVQLAEPGDALDDPSQPWPASRKQVDVGTLHVTAMAPQDSGACRDVNFDPTILPTGIMASGDPILALRSAVYAQSFNRRERELAQRKEQAP